MSSEEVGDYLAHFQYRILQDALNEATRSYWLRRAAVYEWVKPHIGEYHGLNGRDELSAQWRRAHATAQACRNRAEMALIQDEYPEVVWGALMEAGEPCQDVPTRRAS